MQKDMKVQFSHPLPSEDAELRDILIAISVVAKRLATNLENQNIAISIVSFTCSSIICSYTNCCSSSVRKDI